MVRKYVRVFAILSIIAIMLVGCGNTEQSGASNESSAVESAMAGVAGDSDNTGAIDIIGNNDNTDAAGNTDAGVDTPDSSDTVTSTDESTPTETPEPVHEHSYTSAVTKEATCSESGETTYSCDCGDTYKEDIEKISHTESDWIVVTEVTATTDGLQHKVCTVCNEELASEVVSCATFVVASGTLADGNIEWKIVGTTLYVSGEGAIPGFSFSTGQSRRFPEIYLWDELVAWQPYDEIVEKIVIEEGITEIGKNNFCSFKKVKEIIFADSVIEVDALGCNGLGVESIDLNKITKLGANAFGGLDNLKSLTVPGTIKIISESCFWHCDSLVDVYIEDGVEIIDNGAFFEVNETCCIHLPASVIDFGTTVEEYSVEPVFEWGNNLYVKSGSYAEQFLTEYVEESVKVWGSDKYAYTVILE